MNTVKENQKLTIGKYRCTIININKKWWCGSATCSTNEQLFTQFGITRQDIENLIGYKTEGYFPKCKTAEELTKVIEFIMSKDPANQPDCHPDKIPSIPEYVECISDDFWTIKLNRIYKLDPRSTSDNYWLKDINMGYSSSKFFKPSTKAEYEAQFITKFKVGDYVISDYSYLTLPRHRVSQVLEVSDVGRIKLKEGEFNLNDFRLATNKEKYPKLAEEIKKNIEDTISKEIDAVYTYVGDPLPTIKTKPLIENVQSISVNLRTKNKTKKLKF